MTDVLHCGVKMGPEVGNCHNQTESVIHMDERGH